MFKTDVETVSWREASRREPCPVCEKPDWCSLTGPDGNPEAVLCMRVESNNRRDNGGWLHRLTNPDVPIASPRCRGDGDVNTLKPLVECDNVAVATNKTREFQDQDAVLAAWQAKLGIASALYEYHDAQRDVVAVVGRWHRTDGKTIRQASRAANGRWHLKALAKPRPLYRLPQLLACKVDEGPVLIVEGEKCVEAAEKAGLTATTWAGGCKAINQTDFTPLAGRNLVLLPDHDEPGRQAMRDLAEKLSRLQPTPSLRVLNLDELSDGKPMPVGGDLFDWLNADGSTDRLQTLLAEAPSVEAAPSAQPLVWRPFPIETLPSGLRSFVTETARVVQVDPAMVACPALAAAAAVIGSSRVIELTADWIEPSILWLAVVAPSGAGKTPAANKALHPINQLDEQLRNLSEHNQAEHLVAAERHALEKQAWKAEGASGEAPQPPSLPPELRLLTSDITVERLAELLADNPRGLLLAVDELSGLLASMDRYRTGRGGGDRAAYLSAWSAQPIRNDRKTGDRRSTHVPSPRLSLFGGIQSDLLAKVLSDQDVAAGLAARFLWCSPPPKRQRFSDTRIAPEYLERYQETFDALAKLDPGDDTADGAARPLIVSLSDAARKVFAEFYDRLSDQIEDLDGPATGLLSKLRGYGGRLALVLHTWALAERGDQTAGVISDETMRRAVRLTEWFADEALRLFDQRDESPQERENRQLVAWIQRKGGIVTPRDLARGPQKYRGAASNGESALQTLVEAGFGRWVYDDHDGGRGKPTRRFWLSSFDQSIDQR